MPSNQPPRREVVHALVQAGSTGIYEYAAANQTTQDEIFSAYMTLALRAIEVAIEMKLPMEAFRGAVAKMWALLPVAGKAN